MDILFHNADFAVCIKPVGLDSEHRLPEELKNQLGGEIYTLHRLDMNVGGVSFGCMKKHGMQNLYKAIISVVKTPVTPLNINIDKNNKPP